MTKPHAQARAWRERRGLDLDQLSELSGYSVSALRQLEAGKRFGGASHSQWAWHRYRMVCAGVEAQLRSGRVFEW